MASSGRTPRASKPQGREDSSPASDAARPQCHFISNTHWDREWKASFQQTRHALVHMLDLLLDLFRTQPEYRQFHLDSQTIPLLDYLELRPEREAELRELVTTGRLTVGPWFCLPDEYCVAGESLIRNLLLGHRIAQRFGRVAKTGYTPFSWGQISQMPQIYRGFGVELMMFYRGVNSRVAPQAEFLWEAPDGTAIVASRLAARPRYNVWYLLQRPAYWGKSLAALHDFAQPWNDGSGPFRIANAMCGHRDYRLLHPPYAYDADVMPAAAAAALREQDGAWRTPHRLWSCGHDGSSPDAREVRLVQDAQAALAEHADVFWSDFERFQAAILAAPRDGWPVLTGEMRHTFTAGSTSTLLGWIISARTYLKQDNHATERLLTHAAEPLAVFARLWGAEYPQASLDLAYRYLLSNHPHDSIGGAGRDVVHDDMLYRSRQAREISWCVLDDALARIAGAVDVSGFEPNDVAVLLCNPELHTREAVVALHLDLPADWPATGFEILDDADQPVAFQCVGTPAVHSSGVHNPNDVQLFFDSRRQEIRVHAQGLPGCGYQTYRVRPRPTRRLTQPATMCTGPQTFENEHLRVQINPNGTLCITHRATGRVFDDLGYFRDSGAAGTAWEHAAPADDREYTTLNEPPRVARLYDGAFECRHSVAFDWLLPVGLADDGRRRSATLVPVRIANIITLRRGEPWVEVETTVENTVRDHYLRVSFPSGVATDEIAARIPFDIVSRAIPTPDYAEFDDRPQAEQPWQGFVGVRDERGGLALLGDGLRAYEAHDDAARTVSLTLLRAFALRFYVPDGLDDLRVSQGSQCPGTHTFRYAIVPHGPELPPHALWTAAERFNTPVWAAQFAPTPNGTRPRTGAFLEIEPAELQLSAVKTSESGQGVIVRLFNPTTEAVSGRIRLGNGRSGPSPCASPAAFVAARQVLPTDDGSQWHTVREVTLEEALGTPVRLERDGWVHVRVPGKRIYTLEFVRQRQNPPPFKGGAGGG